MESDHSGIVPIISFAWGERTFFGEVGGRGFVETKNLPADTLIALASAAHLPYAHDVFAFFGDADRVHLYDAGEAIVPKFKANVAL